MKTLSDFKEMETDVDKWLFLIGQEHELDIILDNDETYASDGEQWVKFDSSIGDMRGIFDLLDALGIVGRKP